MPLARRPLPLPAIPAPAAGRTRSTIYRTAVIDAGGHIRNRTVLETLGWTPTTSLIAFLQLGQLILRPDPAGTNLITPHGHVCLPLDPRRALQLRAGDHVLLAADPVAHELAVLPEVLLDRLLDGGAIA